MASEGRFYKMTDINRIINAVKREGVGRFTGP
jgi:hypothetical protein